MTALKMFAGAIAAFAVSTTAGAQTSTVTIAPDIGVNRQVTPGEVMYSEETGVTVPGVVIAGPVDVTWSGGLELVNLASGATLMIVSERGRKLKACQSTASVTLSNVAVNGYKNCLIDDQADGLFEKAAFNEVTPFGRMLTTPVAYERRAVFIEGSRVPSTRREMVYAGSDGQVLRLTYREFASNMARPAFSEDLTIPLRADFPQQVAAKGRVFTITQLGGLGLSYRRDR